jgi:hypothetical protein
MAAPDRSFRSSEKTVVIPSNLSRTFVLRILLGVTATAFGRSFAGASVVRVLSSFTIAGFLLGLYNFWLENTTFGIAGGFIGIIEVS